MNYNVILEVDQEHFTVLVHLKHIFVLMVRMFIRLKETYLDGCWLITPASFPPAWLQNPLLFPHHPHHKSHHIDHGVDHHHCQWNCYPCLQVALRTTATAAFYTLLHHNVDPDLKFFISRVLAHRWLNEVWDIECTQISVTFTHDWPVSGCDIIGVSNGSVDVANHQHCTCHDGMADQVIDGWVMVWLTCMTRSSYGVLQFNLMRVEIRELRPKVVTKDDEVLVHYWSRTNVTMVIF